MRRYLPALLLACAAFLIVVPTASAQTIGEQVTFQVEKSFDHDDRQSVVATLRAAGTHSLIYVENTYFNGLSAQNQNSFLAAANAIRNEFDNTIYPKLTAFYGKPAEPGIDNDIRITLLLTHMRQNAGGYFDTSDSFTKLQAPKSNEREMLYVSSVFYTNPRRMYSFVAHEFTHLIDFNQKHLLRGVDEEVWLNEMRAEYASTVAGYDTPYAGSNVASRVAAYLSDPDTSLTEWLNESEDYAATNIFAQYMAGKYGADVLKHAMQTSATGITAIEYGLDQMGAPKDFADIFQDWLVANLINSSQPGLEYVYNTPSLTGAALRVGSTTVSVSVSKDATVALTRQVEDWAGQWLRLTPTSGGSDSLTLTLTSDTALRAKALLTHATGGGYTVSNFTPIPGGATFSVSNLGTYTAVTVVPVLMGKRSGFSTGASDGAYDQEPLRTYRLEAQRTDGNIPVLTDVSPAFVLPQGGVPVTLRGANFAQGAVVRVGTQEVSAQILDASTLLFTAPARAQGQACISVTAGVFSAQRCDLLTYGTYPSGTLLRAQGDHRVWITKGTWRRHIVTPRIFDFYGHLGFANVQVVPREALEQYRVSAWVRTRLTEDPMTWRIYEVNEDESKHWITCADPDNCANTWKARGGDPVGVFTINDTELRHYVTGPHVFLE